MGDELDAKTTGRLAGLAYLAIIVFATFGYTSTTRLLAGDAQTMQAQVAAHQVLFIAAMAASVAGLAAWIALAGLLYRLMNATGRIAGLLMLAFVVAGVTMTLMALSQLLPLVRAANLDVDRLAPLVAGYNRILLLSQLFSGLWLLPFGWLVVRSRIAPQLIGICLMIGAFGYLSVFATAFAPGLDHIAAYKIAGQLLGIAVLIGEAGICLWLLIMGAREPRAAAPLVRLERAHMRQGRAAQRL